VRPVLGGVVETVGKLSEHRAQAARHMQWVHGASRRRDILSARGAFVRKALPQLGREAKLRILIQPIAPWSCGLGLGNAVERSVDLDRIAVSDEVGQGVNGIKLSRNLLLFQRLW
jgi:hypothetical protein